MEKNKQHYYVYDDPQLEALYAEIGKRIKDVQRYKGLGEMDFDQLAGHDHGCGASNFEKVDISDVRYLWMKYSVCLWATVWSREGIYC